VVDAIRATVANTQEDMTDMAADEAALAALREDSQAWWVDTLAGRVGSMASSAEPFAKLLAQRGGGYVIHRQQ